MISACEMPLESSIIEEFNADADMSEKSLTCGGFVAIYTRNNGFGFGSFFLFSRKFYLTQTGANAQIDYVPNNDQSAGPARPVCARLRPEAAAAAAATVAVRVSPKLKPKPLTGAEGDETLAMFSAPEHDEAAGIQIIRVLMASASRRSQ